MRSDYAMRKERFIAYFPDFLMICPLSDSLFLIRRSNYWRLIFVCIIIQLAQDIFLFNFIRYAKYFF